MRAVIVLSLLAALLALCSFPALAQTAPPAPKQYGILSVARLALAAGGQYDWNSGAAAPVAKEFAAGGHLGYVLTTHLSLDAHGVYGFDSKGWRVAPGAHYRLPDGVTKAGSLAWGLSYEYYAGNQIPTFQHEWAASVIWALPIPGFSRLLFGASEVYGFDNKVWRTSVGFQLPIWLGKES